MGSVVSEFLKVCSKPRNFRMLRFTEGGEQTITIEEATAQGCDSIVTLHVTVNEAQYGDYYSTICDSQIGRAHV